MLKQKSHSIEWLKYVVRRGIEPKYNSGQINTYINILINVLHDLNVPDVMGKMVKKVEKGQKTLQCRQNL